MFSSGPKSRTTAAVLAIFLGWAGIHKFYLVHRNVGCTHVALTAVGLAVLLARFTAGDAGSVIIVQVAAWVAILLGYFYVRRFHLGHTMAEAVSLGRLLLWPWRLVRYTFRLTRAGASMMESEEEERNWRQRRRRRRGRWGRRRDDDDDDNDGGGRRSIGCVVIVLGIAMSLAVAAAIVALYYFIFAFVGYVALAGSVAIGVIEGVIYLRKSDDRFEREYVAGRMPWF